MIEECEMLLLTLGIERTRETCGVYERNAARVNVTISCRQDRLQSRVWLETQLLIT